MTKKFKIGITGGIGSGKTIVCHYLESLGHIVLKADDVAKKLMSDDEKIKRKLIKTFGQQSFVNGKPNTKFLADEIFSDQEKLKLVNSIIHPPTLKYIETECDKILTTKNLVFVESALIYEAKFQKMFDYVILLTADEKLRIDRVKKRDNSEEEKIYERMKFQLPDEIKKEKASFVIENNSTIEDLKLKVQFILNLLTVMGG